ncbi:hypothetical protein D4R75_03800 [bacterium]|nr:MAG: hypothetical protein D4R75_03800 [bacterium]
MLKAELPDVRRQFGFLRFDLTDSLFEGLCGVDHRDDLVLFSCDNLHFGPTDGAHQINLLIGSDFEILNYSSTLVHHRCVFIRNEGEA